MPPNEQTGGAASPTGVKTHKDLVLSSKDDAKVSLGSFSSPEGPMEEKAGQRPDGHAQEDGVEASSIDSSICIPDEVIRKDWLYRCLQRACCWYGRVFHSYTMEGTENIPASGACLIVGLHTSHNTDIPISAFYQEQVTGRVPRCLLHSTADLLRPWFRRIGCVVGNRKVAKELLGQGYAGACIPGGVEEAMLHCSSNGQHAYALNWESYNGRRKIGFAHVALSMGPGFTVLPSFNLNGEEMRMNPVYEAWSFLGLDSLYGHVMRLMPPAVRGVMWKVAFLGWIVASLASVPVPVKVTAQIGAGVRVREGETAEELAERVRASFEALLDAKLGQGNRSRDYARGLRSRWHWLFPGPATPTPNLKAQ